MYVCHPAVPYLSTGLIGCSMGSGISRSACKLARTSRVIKKLINFFQQNQIVLHVSAHCLFGSQLLLVIISFIFFFFYVTQWMPIEEYVAQPFNQKHESFKNIANICLRKSRRNYTGFSAVPMSSSSGKKSYSYFNKLQLENETTN